MCGGWGGYDTVSPISHSAAACSTQVYEGALAAAYGLSAGLEALPAHAREERIATEVDTLQLVVALGYTIATSTTPFDDGVAALEPTPRRQKERATALPTPRSAVVHTMCAVQVRGSPRAERSACTMTASTAAARVQAGVETMRSQIHDAIDAATASMPAKVAQVRRAPWLARSARGRLSASGARSCVKCSRSSKPRFEASRSLSGSAAPHGREGGIFPLLI